MTSYIYFIQAANGGPIKIGTTSFNPFRRMAKIQSDCPWPVTLLGAIEGTLSQEKQIHRTLRYFRTSGEWFSAHPKVLAAVDAALQLGKRAEFPTKRNAPLSERNQNTVSSLVEALGGTNAVAKLTGNRQSVVSNWRKRGRFLARTFVRLSSTLQQHNLVAPNSLWSMP